VLVLVLALLPESSPRAGGKSGLNHETGGF